MFPHFDGILMSLLLTRYTTLVNYIKYLNTDMNWCNILTNKLQDWIYFGSRNAHFSQLPVREGGEEGVHNVVKKQTLFWVCYHVIL